MFKRAAKEAFASNHHTYKMGAVIVKKKRILSTASNRVNRSTTLIRKKKWPNTLHAEAHAILKLLRSNHVSSLVGADLYVTRINKVGHLMCSKPCEFCADLAYSVGISRIFYTNKEGKQSCLKF